MFRCYFICTFMTVLLLTHQPAFASSDEELLKAFNDAARSLPPPEKPPGHVSVQSGAKQQEQLRKALNQTRAETNKLRKENVRLQARLDELSQAPTNKAPVLPADATTKAQLVGQTKELARLTQALAAAEKQSADIGPLKAELAKAQAEAKKNAEQLKARDTDGSKRLTVLTTEKKQQAEEIARLTQALSASEKQSAGIAPLKAELAKAQAEAKKNAEQLKARDTDGSKQLTALTAEKKQQAGEIARLTQALSAAEKQSAGIASLKAELAKAQAEAKKNAEQLKAQDADSSKQLTVLTVEKKQQAEEIARLTQALSAAEKQSAGIAPLKAELAKAQAEAKKNAEQLKAQDADGSKQLTVLTAEKMQQAEEIARLTQALATAEKQSSFSLSPPATDTERDSYTLGQFFASNSLAELQIFFDAGFAINLAQLITGYRSQLETGESLLSIDEMKKRHSSLQNKMAVVIKEKIEAGYKSIQEKTTKLKSAGTENQIYWFTVKAGKGMLKPEQQATVSVKINTLDGKVIDNFKEKNVLFSQDLPYMLKKSLSLSGTGGQVEGWALAKDIFEYEQLPRWVAPYDVIIYSVVVS